MVWMVFVFFFYVTVNLEVMCESWEGYKNLGFGKIMWSRGFYFYSFGIERKVEFCGVKLL